MPKYAPLTKATLQDRIKDLQQRIVQMERRDQTLDDLKKWMERHKLEPTYILWMYRQMAPTRATKAVKSKRPLQPLRGVETPRGPSLEPKGDPAFRAAIRKARTDRNWSTQDVADKVGVSIASISNWEVGRFVPMEGMRAKLCEVLGLPPDLGKEATAAMMTSMGADKRTNKDGDKAGT